MRGDMFRRKVLAKFAVILSLLASLSLLIYLTSLSTANPKAEVEEARQLEKRLPQAIIIGTRKSGTRALLKFLGLNSRVKSAHREVHFFDKPHNYKLGLDWYRDQMPATMPGEITIEKSPAYFVTKGVPEKIKAMNSSIKLILIFRNPVTRLISDYSQLVANKIYESANITSTLADSEYDDDRESDNRNGSEDFIVTDNRSVAIWQQAERQFEDHVLREDGGIDELRRSVRTGMYSVHLESWRAQFPIEQFHFVDGEVLVKSPHLELQKLERFLGLDSQIRREHFVFNQKKGFYCIVKDHGYESHSKDRQNRTKRTVEASSSQSICLSKSKGRRHVGIRAGLVESLQDFYAPYNEYLYTLIGKNFHWY